MSGECAVKQSGEVTKPNKNKKCSVRWQHPEIPMTIAEECALNKDQTVFQHFFHCRMIKKFSLSFLRVNPTYVQVCEGDSIVS